MSGRSTSTSYSNTEMNVLMYASLIHFASLFVFLFAGIDRHAIQNHNLKIINKSFQREEHFGYLRTTLRNQNSMHKKIKDRLKSGISWYHSVQHLLSSILLSKNSKIRTFKIILPVVLWGCEDWSLTLREERRLRVFENRVLKGIFGLKRDEVTGEWRRLHACKGELYELYSSSNISRVIK
jgi:uncharacterized membrane protein YsdA (DUF1294 family)